MFGLPLVGESRGYDFDILAPVYESYTRASAPERDECHDFRREVVPGPPGWKARPLVDYTQLLPDLCECLQPLSEVVAVVRG